ncbi:MAG: peptidase domain-containing ABC transporter [Gemmataceae bacterium]
MFRRYACVRQADQSDCGAAALATILHHYRRPVPLHVLREMAGTDRVGTTLRGMVEGAEKVGLTARAVKGQYEALAGVTLPAIAHVRTDEGLGHFVVLHKITPKGAVVADPARGVATLSKDEFCGRWTGYLLLVEPSKAPQTGTGKPVAPWVRFLSLLGGHKPLLAEAVVCALVMTVLGVSTSYFVQHLVDGVLPRGERRLLHALGIGMVIVVAMRTAFGLVREYLLSHVGRKVDLALIAGYSRHVLRLPVKFFETRQVGEIISRVQDAAKVREAVSGTAVAAVVDGLLVVLLTVVLFVYDVKLAAAACAFVPVLLLGVLLHHPAAKRRSLAAMEDAAKFSARIVEDVTGVETVKAYGAERARAEADEDCLVALMKSIFGIQKLTMSTNALALAVTTLAGIVVLWYGGIRVLDGALTIGELMFFYSLLGYVLGPLERLASVNLKIQDALVAVDRLYQVLDLETEPVGDVRKARFAGIRAGVELKDVGFRYGCRAKVLDGVNLRIPAGQTVALVGESGSGKSTLLKLLLGYYGPTEGSLRVDGVDLRDIELGSLRAGTALVSQEPFVFNGTLRENVAVAKPRATLAEIAAAIRAAGLEEFINGLPERFDTVIGERGANLSGGQRQRLAIARALLRQPDFLIFDEATSHLDTATERAIQENLRTALVGKTVLLVAHRLSTVKDADLICVMHQGRVVEQGTHAELLAANARYAALWRAQTEGPAYAPRRSHAELCLN